MYRIVITLILYSTCFLQCHVKKIISVYDGALSGTIIVGISGIYQPANVETQPQPQQQLQSPPTLGKRLTGPQGQQQQQSNTGTLVQIQQDKALVDRLFPYIIQKIDGQTLLQKIDAKTLAGKLLPHIRVTLDGAISTSDRIEVRKGATDSDTYHHVYAKCAPGTILWGGGGHVRDSYLNDWRRSPEDNWLVETGIAETGNQWKITAKMSSSGDIYAKAICRKISVALVP
jgi:hypothetical protein